MKRKKLVRSVFILVIAVLMAVCFAACSKNEKTVASPATENGYEKAVIRYGSIYNAETIYGKALEKMKADIEAASGEMITVDIFHGGTLGSEQEHAQAQKEGSIEMLFSGTAGIGLYVPATAIFEVWYAFADIDQLAQAVESLWDTLDGEMQKSGFKLLGAYYDGPRNILSNKMVTSIQELKGLKLRSPGANIYVNSISALGAQAIAMPFGDVYTSLQTGAIEAMEGTTDTIYQQKFYEQGKYLIQDSHVFQPLFVTYNLAAWNKLPAKSQELIQKAVRDSMTFQMEQYRDMLNKEIEEMKAGGVQLVSITDRPKWVDSVQEATQAYVANYGEVGQEIYDVVKSFRTK